ncbi:hypothetical protein KKC91_02265 [bacterium]|nr:hypothetical protein [bacterium]
MIKGDAYHEKNIVIVAVLRRLNNMEKPNKISKGTGVKDAPKLSSGNDLMLNDSMNNTGLIYGLKKATALDNYAISQVTVSSNSNTLKIIGSNNYLMNSLTILSTNI